MDAIKPAPDELPPAVENIQQIKAGTQLIYYVADVVVPNDGSLYSGMTGTAKMVIRRESFAGLAWRAVSDFVDRKVW